MSPKPRYPQGRIPWCRNALAGAACLALAFGWSIAPPAAAQGPGGSGHTRTYGEYAVKAAFLYNFAKFTQWPDASGPAEMAPIRVCVLGQDPFGAALDAIHGRRIKARKVVTARVSAVAEARACQVLFISVSEADRLAAILGQLRREPVLTVTDLARGTEPRGIVHLETVAEKVRFAIDTERAAAAGLSFSSKLLSLAGPQGGTAAVVPPSRSGLGGSSG